MTWRAKTDGRGVAQVALFGLALLAYQSTRGLSIGDAQLATSNGVAVLLLERRIGLDVESAVQGWALGFPTVLSGLSLFYLIAHLTVTAGFFGWLWYRHRAAYFPVRNVFLVANALALVVYALYPLAPPRLVAASGLADTVNTHAGIDLHGGGLSAFFNPFAAMPSMHFAYALLIGIVVWRIATTPWVRVVAAAYPLTVLFVIVATGNHYVLDAVGGLMMLVGAVLLVEGYKKSRRAHAAPRPADRPAGTALRR